MENPRKKKRRPFIPPNRLWSNVVGEQVSKELHGRFPEEFFAEYRSLSDMEKLTEDQKKRRTEICNQICEFRRTRGLELAEEEDEKWTNWESKELRKHLRKAARYKEKLDEKVAQHSI